MALAQDIAYIICEHLPLEVLEKFSSIELFVHLLCQQPEVLLAVYNDRRVPDNEFMRTEISVAEQIIVRSDVRFLLLNLMPELDLGKRFGQLCAFSGVVSYNSTLYIPVYAALIYAIRQKNYDLIRAFAYQLYHKSTHNQGESMHLLIDEIAASEDDRIFTLTSPLYSDIPMPAWTLPERFTTFCHTAGKTFTPDPCTLINVLKYICPEKILEFDDTEFPETEIDVIIPFGWRGLARVKYMTQVVTARFQSGAYRDSYLEMLKVLQGIPPKEKSHKLMHISVLVNYTSIPGHYYTSASYSQSYQLNRPTEIHSIHTGASIWACNVALTIFDNLPRAEVVADVRGVRGIRGATGAMGVTGATGPPGHIGATTIGAHPIYNRPESTAPAIRIEPTSARWTLHTLTLSNIVSNALLAHHLVPNVPLLICLPTDYLNAQAMLPLREHGNVIFAFTMNDYAKLRQSWEQFPR